MRALTRPLLQRSAAAAGIAVGSVLVAGYFALRSPPAGAAAVAAAKPSASSAPPTVQLADSQLRAIRVAPVAERDFVRELDAVGSIDFDENRSLAVYTPYAGRILEARVDVGDEVRAGQVLFSVESPDFIQAQSTLIAAAATLDQTRSALERARQLYAVQGMDQNDYEAAVAAGQAAEGALQAARQALAVFGRSSGQIDHILATRTVERMLLVRSPFGGRVTARAAAPGLYVQPGNAPAPYSVADLSDVWMLAAVAEADVPSLRVGQEVQAEIAALPGRSFTGRVAALGASVDPLTHRLIVRTELQDPAHELRPGMLASYRIRTGHAQRSVAVPLDAVVREGDGSMSVWVAGSDPHRFVRRAVTLGQQRDGYDQILEGLRSGERVAIEGAIFLSNIAFGGAT